MVDPQPPHTHPAGQIHSRVWTFLRRAFVKRICDRGGIRIGEDHVGEMGMDTVFWLHMLSPSLFKRCGSETNTKILPIPKSYLLWSPESDMLKKCGAIQSVLQGKGWMLWKELRKKNHTGSAGLVGGCTYRSVYRSIVLKNTKIPITILSDHTAKPNQV